MNPAVFSGTPYHFLAAAVAGGILDAGVALPEDGASFHIRRIVWNATRPLTGDRHGGYQYTVARRNRQWAAIRPTLEGSCILSAWQLLPKSVILDGTIEKWFFIDQTLSQLYDEYGERAIIGRRIARNALSEERDGYDAATGIIAHSQWAARSVMEQYGCAPSKVHVVTQAANIDMETYKDWEAREQVRRDRDGPRRESDSMRLVFVGLDGPRKGLDRLLRAMELARAKGSRTTLRVIGCPPERMPRHLRSIPGVEWCGRVNKHADPGHFLDLLAECDVGCLLSRIEAGGCSLSEYQALGLAVLGTSAGGAAEQVFPASGIIVDVDATDQSIADTLMQLEHEPGLVERMREVSWTRRRDSVWAARVAEVRTFWPYSDDEPDQPATAVPTG